MLRDIEAFSGHLLGPGTLYGAIERLEHDGLIEPLPPEDRRTPYRLTDSGRAHLVAEVAELHQLFRAASERVRA
jgi:DNA-binding PadR family transcriptional regulator